MATAPMRRQPVEEFLAAAMVAGRGLPAAVVSEQPTTATPTDREALQQRRAFSHGATGLMRLRARVGGESRLVGLESRPIKEAGMMLSNEHSPLIDRKVTDALLDRALLIDVTLRWRRRWGESIACGDGSLSWCE